MPLLLLALVVVAVAVASKKSEGAAAAPGVAPSLFAPGALASSVPSSAAQTPAAPPFLDWMPAQTPAAATPAATPAGLMLDETDTGKSLELDIGATFSVRLPEPASTGYVWSVVQLPPSVEQLGQPQQIPGPSTPGSTGGTMLTFRAKTVGSGRLVIGLSRPFEPEAAPSRTWEQDLNVWSRPAETSGASREDFRLSVIAALVDRGVAPIEAISMANQWDQLIRTSWSASRSARDVAREVLKFERGAAWSLGSHGRGSESSGALGGAWYYVVTYTQIPNGWQKTSDNMIQMTDEIAAGILNGIDGKTTISIWWKWTGYGWDLYVRRWPGTTTIGPGASTS